MTCCLSIYQVCSSFSRSSQWRSSPGPATLMILGTAISRGRSSAVALSLGVVTGSLFWGCIAAFGFVAAIKASVGLFSAMKVAGGLYLFYLAFRSWRSALTSSSSFQVQPGTTVSLKRNYVRGLLLHLTNEGPIGLAGNSFSGAWGSRSSALSRLGYPALRNRRDHSVCRICISIFDADSVAILHVLSPSI